MKSERITVKVKASTKSMLTAASRCQVEELYPLSEEQEKAFLLDSKLNLKYVKLYAERICKAFPELRMELEPSVESHDATKYEYPEHYGYVWYVSDQRLQYPPPTKMVHLAMTEALLHHSQMNPHHLEYWISRGGVETMPDWALAHWFADLCYSAKIENRSMITTLREQLGNYLFSEHQEALAQKFLSCFPELCKG